MRMSASLICIFIMLVEVLWYVLLSMSNVLQSFMQALFVDNSDMIL